VRSPLTSSQVPWALPSSFLSVWVYYYPILLECQWLEKHQKLKTLLIYAS
jgi:hypothetical protein